MLSLKLLVLISKVRTSVRVMMDGPEGEPLMVHINVVVELDSKLLFSIEQVKSVLISMNVL